MAEPSAEIVLSTFAEYIKKRCTEKIDGIQIGFAEDIPRLVVCRLAAETNNKARFENFTISGLIASEEDFLLWLEFLGIADSLEIHTQKSEDDYWEAYSLSPPLTFVRVL